MFNLILELIGTWRLEREIENFGQASGKAFFSKIEQNLISYREDLVLFNGTNSFREYYYTADLLHGNTLQLFSDKRIFCVLDFNKELRTAEGKHICGKDYYFVKYFFSNKDSFVTEYKILGPNKKAIILTEYLRVS